MPYELGLHGKVALVTGASRGIGRSIAIALAQGGATVIGVSRGGADLAGMPSSSDGSLATWHEDVTTDAFLARLEALPQLDILVNNAGMNRPMPMGEVDVATLDAMLGLNVRAMFRVSRAAARLMLETGARGSIIQMSSQMGHVGAADRTVYCMTKHAVEGLTKAMAVELGPAGIRVNSVAPTFIETELTRPMLADPKFLSSVIDSIPLGRVGVAEDVVGAVLFLASDAAAMITGSSIKVDGGWTAR